MAERRFREGDRVRFCPTLPCALKYGTPGTVEGEPWDEDGELWCLVIIDGEDFPTEFKVSELQRPNEETSINPPKGEE